MTTYQYLIKQFAYVLAGSHNEAAVRGLAAFEKNAFAELLNGPHSDTKLLAQVLSEERHEVSVAEAKDWLERHGPPFEVALKGELKELFPPPPETTRRKRGRR